MRQFIEKIKIERKILSSDIIKYILSLEDKFYIEAVTFLYNKSTVLCISSQVGCPVKCLFCRTGQDSFKRNMSAEEIIGEVLLISKDLQRKIDIISFMGMGEPLLNYDNVIKSIKFLKNYYKFSNSQILVSTVGIPYRIYELANEALPIKLYFSLHAPSDKKRSNLIPFSFPIRILFRALDYYSKTKKSARQSVTVVYLLLRGINDTRDDLKKLIKLLKKRNFPVILKNYCNTDLSFKKLSRSALKVFCEGLEKAGIKYRISESYGEEIEAGCGQLRQQYLESRITNQRSTSINLCKF